MTREEAIKVLNAVDENASCDDCLYYAQMEDCPTDDDCIIRKAIWMAIQALENHDTFMKYAYSQGKHDALSQEPNRDMKEIAEIMESDADAETKCKMISNILTAKPHYFEKQEPTTTTNNNEPMTVIYPTIVCDDAISRDFLFKVLDDFCGHDRTATITLDTLADLVYELPSVTPTCEEREKGECPWYAG